MSFSAMAQNAVATTSTDALFKKGFCELQVAGGFFFSQNFHDVARPQMNDLDAMTRLGWVITDPILPGILRGNFEVMAEFFGGGFVKGPADALGGASLFLQYNVVQPNAKFVPYWHVGLGGAYSDGYQSQPQRELGSPMLFDVQAGFGSRFLINEKWGIFLEANWRHLSNGGLSERNTGLNSAGSWLGVSWFF